jgi:predicted regulator of Ras-like GTPase activity (Roadblock/LC7/MglB family)
MASISLLPGALQNTLQQIIIRTNQAGAGIRAILLSTTEGVPLGRLYATDQPLNEDVLASIESVWAPASKQLPVLGLEKAQQVTAIYDHGILIHVYQTPVIVTILCNPQSNIGAIRSSGIPLLKEVLEPLCTTLNNSLRPDYESDPVYQQ